MSGAEVAGVIGIAVGGEMIPPMPMCGPCKSIDTPFPGPTFISPPIIPPIRIGNLLGMGHFVKLAFELLPVPGISPLLLISASSIGFTGPYPYPGDGVGLLFIETPKSTDVPVEIWLIGVLTAAPADTLTLGMLTIGLAVIGLIIIPVDPVGWPLLLPVPSKSRSEKYFHVFFYTRDGI